MDERVIIQKILEGDSEQYKVLLKRYQTGLVRHCFTMIHNYDTANDIAQEACVKAFFQLNKYKESYRFSTWLYKISTNLCLDYLKKRRHISLDDISEPMSTSLSPQELTMRNESAKEIHQAVSQLKVKYQTVISLYYWQDCSYEEIAEILNVPIGTVRTWLKRAKEQLKKELHG